MLVVLNFFVVAAVIFGALAIASSGSAAPNAKSSDESSEASKR